jgi:hypothetical protein
VRFQVSAHIVVRRWSDLITPIPDRFGRFAADVAFASLQHIHQSIHGNIGSRDVTTPEQIPNQYELTQIGIKSSWMGAIVKDQDKLGKAVNPAVLVDSNRRWNQDQGDSERASQ